MNAQFFLMSVFWWFALFSVLPVYADTLRVSAAYSAMEAPDRDILSIVLAEPVFEKLSKEGPSQFILLENEKETDSSATKITSFIDSDWSLALVVLVDTSGTMEKRRGGISPLKDVRVALEELSKIYSGENPERLLKEKDRLALFSFEDEVKLLSGFNEEKAEIKSHVARLIFDKKGPNKTHLFDGIARALEELDQVQGPKVEKRILVISDGYDEDSEHTEEEVLRLAEMPKPPNQREVLDWESTPADQKYGQKYVPIDFIARMKKDIYERMISEGKIQRMRRLSETTGGYFVWANKGRVWDDIKKLLDGHIQNRSVVTFDRRNVDPAIVLPAEKAALRWKPQKKGSFDAPLPIAIPASTPVAIPTSPPSPPWWHAWVLPTVVLLILIALLEWYRAFRGKRERDLVIPGSWTVGGEYATALGGAGSGVRADVGVDRTTRGPSRRRTMRGDDDRSGNRRLATPASSHAAAFLIGKDGSMRGRQVAIGKSEFFIGADPSNDLTIERDDYVSARHAVLRYQQDSGAVYLSDRNSTNGTFLNEKRLSPKTPVLLGPGDRIRVGRTTFELRRPVVNARIHSGSDQAVSSRKTRVGD